MLVLFLALMATIGIFLFSDYQPKWVEEIIKYLPLVLIFTIALILVISRRWKEARRRRGTNQAEVNLVLTYYDKILTDAFIFVLPIVVLAAAIFLGYPINGGNVVGAFAAFGVMFIWRAYLFSQEG
ncbi:hypothetical protein D6821_00725 [Candidatus Parcubacteria bacterium]|nr:MAG: hypothetical protein D6821_00725 [Candidatus Parcubacteria bacterium]